MISITVKQPNGVFERLEEKMVGAARKMLRDVTFGAHREWSQAASRFLRKSQPAYESALQQPKKVDEDTYEIVLQSSDAKENFLATAIEVGYDAFDIKPGLLKATCKAAYEWSVHSERSGGAKLGAPFVDVPFKVRPSITQKDPDHFRRVSKQSTGWEHPGFTPGGPRRQGVPLREVAKEYIKEKAKEKFLPLLAKIRL